jgi:hypothetical protein
LDPVDQRCQKESDDGRENEEQKDVEDLAGDEFRLVVDLEEDGGYEQEDERPEGPVQVAPWTGGDAPAPAAITGSPPLYLSPVRTLPG